MVVICCIIINCIITANVHGVHIMWPVTDLSDLEDYLL